MVFCTCTKCCRESNTTPLAGKCRDRVHEVMWPICENVLREVYRISGIVYDNARVKNLATFYCSQAKY